MGNHHQGLSSHVILLVVEELKNLICVLIQDIRESIEKVTKRNYDVCFNSEVYLRIQQLENQLKVVFADFGWDTHVLG